MDFLFNLSVGFKFRKNFSLLKNTYKYLASCLKICQCFVFSHFIQLQINLLYFLCATILLALVKLLCLNRVQRNRECSVENVEYKYFNDIYSPEKHVLKSQSEYMLISQAKKLSGGEILLLSKHYEIEHFHFDCSDRYIE